MTNWLRISDFADYSVSDDGQVVRITPGRGTRLGKMRKPSTTANGYSIVFLRKNRKNVGLLIHRLVAKAFIPNPLNKPEVNHIDGVKTHNASTNLEWVTRQEHLKCTAAQGLVKGERNGGAKLKRSTVLEIRKRGDAGEKHGAIAADYGVTRENVSTICRRETWGWL